MDILFLTPRFYPDVGGVERHLLGVCRVLAARGHRITVLTSGGDGSPKQEQFQGLTIVRFNPPRAAKSKSILVRAFSIFLTWPRIFGALKGIRAPRAVHGHDSAFLAWLFPVWLRFHGGARYVTFHGIEGDKVPAWAPIYRGLSARVAKGIICVGDFMARWYGGECTAVTYGASEGALIPPEAEGRSEALIYVGRLEPYNPLLECLTGMAQLAKDHEALPWDLYGIGVLDEPLRSLADAAGVPISLKGVTHEPEREYPRYAFAIAGGYLSVLEAIRAGCSVIAYARSELRCDYYKSHPCLAKGLVVVQTPEEFATAIHRLRDNHRGRAEAVRRGQRLVAEMTWEALADTYEGIWGVRG